MQVEMLETLVNERGEVKKITKNIALIINKILTIITLKRLSLIFAKRLPFSSGDCSSLTEPGM